MVYDCQSTLKSKIKNRRSGHLLGYMMKCLRAEGLELENPRIESWFHHFWTRVSCWNFVSLIFPHLSRYCTTFQMYSVIWHICYITLPPTFIWQFIFGYNILILIFKSGNKCLSQFPYQTYLTIALHEWSCYSVNPWMICLKLLILVTKTVARMELYGVFWFILVIENFSFILKARRSHQKYILTIFLFFL